MFVIGSREDTKESIEQLRQYSMDLGSDFAIYTILTPFPGTSYYQTAQRNGWIEDQNFANYDMAHAIMPTKYLSTDDVNRLAAWCYREFFSKPERIHRAMNDYTSSYVKLCFKNFMEMAPKAERCFVEKIPFI